MKPLNEKERARVAANVAQVKALMPELVPEIKALHEAGLIEGWRNVAYIGPHRPRPPGERAVHAGQMALESMEKTKERMRNGTSR